MQGYLGETRDPRILKLADAAGVGTVIQRGNLTRSGPPRAWIYDNRVFADFQAGRKWTEGDTQEFLCDVRRIVRMPLAARPDFVVLPDAVGDASRTLQLGWEVLDRMHEHGLRWVANERDRTRDREHAKRIERSGVRFAYVVQNGARPGDGILDRFIDNWRASIRTIFVGGSTGWKLANAQAWCHWAREMDMRCHIGRVGSSRRIRWARFAGADSIDSSLPLWSAAKLRVFLRGLEQARDVRLGIAAETTPAVPIELGIEDDAAPASHLTAIRRTTLSAPARYLLERDMLRGRVLDFGSGRGDLKPFSGLANVTEYDPYWRPNRPRGQFDTVFAGYVLNVLSERETHEALARIRALLRPGGVAYLAVRRDVEPSSARQRCVKLELPLVHQTSSFAIYALRAEPVELGIAV